MYRKRTQGILAYPDLLILDVLCVWGAIAAAYLLREGSVDRVTGLLKNVLPFAACADALCIGILNSFARVLTRSRRRELFCVCTQAAMLFLMMNLYLVAVQSAQDFSRIVLYSYPILQVLLTFPLRLLWKRVIRRLRRSRGVTSMLVITTAEQAPQVLHHLRRSTTDAIRLAGLVLLNRDGTGETIADCPVVCSWEQCGEFLCRSWVDEVLIVPQRLDGCPQMLLDALNETGVVTHLALNQAVSQSGTQPIFETVGDFSVLTLCMRNASDLQLFFKRLLDIVGGLVGCAATGLLYLWIAPQIQRVSPGPVFFSQERVGKNGKTFRIYKFRSMYLDAEARKQELMEKNRISDGMMFKMEFDPRVIGNEIRPDGTRTTGIGDKIRRTSIDEFPQFFNVLKGDMSLVGTRPPTLDEWNRYSPRHRARMNVKPGITGIWQTSGRSEITDFEQVVAMDREYINNWSLALDMKLLAKTVLVVLRHDGAM